MAKARTLETAQASRLADAQAAEALRHLKHAAAAGYIIALMMIFAVKLTYRRLSRHPRVPYAFAARCICTAAQRRSSLYTYSHRASSRSMERNDCTNISNLENSAEEDAEGAREEVGSAEQALEAADTKVSFCITNISQAERLRVIGLTRKSKF